MYVPSYTKILTLGSTGTELALTGEVIVQEKIDGSQFRFMRTEEGGFRFASHRADVYPETPGMFREAVDYIAGQNVAPEGVLFCCEYLQRPKHNTLAYGRIPKNHLVLFDAMVIESGVWVSREILQYDADWLGIELVPELYRGEITKEGLVPLLETPSVLGNQTVEGIVIKNHGQLIALGGRTFPLFTKLVNQAFKERNNKEWRANSGKSQLDNYMDSFRTEARWQKAIQSLREQGLLLGEPKDIGALMREVAQDLEAEEEATIKDQLYAMYRKDIIRRAQSGLPEWYKAKLLETVV